jgi:hypothetical protein
MCADGHPGEPKWLFSGVASHTPATPIVRMIKDI